MITMYYVYILKSLKNGIFYVGYTSDLEDRIKEHNSGKTKGNYFNAPFELFYSEEYANIEDARKRERYIKSQKSRKYIESLVPCTLG